MHCMQLLCADCAAWFVSLCDSNVNHLYCLTVSWTVINSWQFIFNPIPSEEQHFTLGTGPAQIIGQHGLYGCRRLCLMLAANWQTRSSIKHIKQMAQWPTGNWRSRFQVKMVKRQAQLTVSICVCRWTYKSSVSCDIILRSNVQVQTKMCCNRWTDHHTVFKHSSSIEPWRTTCPELTYLKCQRCQHMVYCYMANAPVEYLISRLRTW